MQVPLNSFPESMNASRFFVDQIVSAKILHRNDTEDVLCLKLPSPNPIAAQERPGQPDGEAV